MNLIQLEYYVATIEYGSYAKAGKAYYVSPQAVSKAVADLEKELGIRLIARSSNSISVTKLGMLFAIKAKEVLESARDLVHMAQNAAIDRDCISQITLAVGTQPFRGCAITAAQQLKLASGAGSSQYSLLFNTDGYCLLALSYGFAQAAIIFGRSHDDNQTSIKLTEVPVKVAMWDDHPLAAYSSLSVGDLEGRPIARPYNLSVLNDIFQRHFALNKMKPLYQDVPPTFDSHASFMKKSHGIVFICGDAMGLIGEHVVVKDLVEPGAIAIPVCLVCQSDRTLPPEIQAEMHDLF